MPFYDPGPEIAPILGEEKHDARTPPAAFRGFSMT
jgi:hypothetical protein